MFRMEFKSVDTVVNHDDDCSAGDYMNDSVYERYRESSVDVSCSQTPTVFEGRVGKFGKVQRLSSIVAGTGPKNWKEADHMNFESPSFQGVTQDETSHQAIFLDAHVLRELVKPFAELASVSQQRDSHEDMETMSVSSHGPGPMLSRTDSMTSTSSFRSDSSSDASEGSVAEMNALQRVNKPWEEPLLALHEQEKVNLKAQKEAKLEAERRAEEEKLVAARQQRELRDLANCVSGVGSTGKGFKKSKLQKVLNKTGVTGVYRFLKNPFGLFRSYKVHNGYSNAREANLVIPKRGIYSECYAPNSTNAALFQMRSAPRQSARPDIQFATVNSTQRDVRAWTMEEYMERNARLPKWKRRDDDEEFGGIEGNNLMNQYFDDGVMGTYDSDSD